MANSATYEVRVWHGDVAGGAFVHYDVPAQDSQTVLDAVTWIQQNVAPALSYRFACRVGMCGSCAMQVNGEPRWTCRTHIKKVVAANNVVTIEPLRNLPVIKDLACDMSEFFAKWIKAEGLFHPTKTRDDPIERISPDSKERRQADAGIECINCAVCYSACDVVEAKPDYLGPAALNRAWTLVNDVRDGHQDARLRAVADDAGCHNCHSHQSCMTYCPVGLNPTASIAGLKRKTLMAALKGKL
ncbi:MAG: 2Fe-2S iron-sulfur cluster-binding protein [Burkholderiaceae bacterium]